MVFRILLLMLFLFGCDHKIYEGKVFEIGTYKASSFFGGGHSGNYAKVENSDGIYTVIVGIYPEIGSIVCFKDSSARLKMKVKCPIK